MPYKDPEAEREYQRQYKAQRRATDPRYAESQKAIARVCSKRWRETNKDRVRSHRLKADHGITLAEYRAMVEMQNGCCAICGREEGEALRVDHCHKSQRIRGLLCHNCNVALGHFQDQTQRLYAAIDYLKSYK